MMNKTLLALALAAVSLSASAHRGWLYPQSTMVESKEPWVTIDGAISEGLFDVDHVALKLDGATVTDPDGVSTPAPAGYMGKQRSTFDLKMTKNGTYKISIVNRNVMASYKDKAGEPKRFRGSEEAFAKEVPADAQELKTTYAHQRLETFVSANKTSDGAFKPSGVGLEMIPLTNPTDLRAGETAKWRFQLDGKPLPKFAFSLIPGGVRYRGVLGEVRLETDAKGEVAVTLPAPGMYWLNAGFPAAQPKGPAPADAPAVTRRYSYAATLEVLPE
ncbi:DUF4198 domain-containing protein [Massilia pseudoviolaceinigra]|uniref:DUF4198 domain-containing protein n=1 Tax=Massilia pseudoviolaceinigra TaxID=3057165 RepID=UPI0027B8D517|nr:DUF4198 domain-containing protein [Massilia sp. CCM 9206]